MNGYLRVIPRDLFNEASLLKCYGHLWIQLEQTVGHCAELSEGTGTGAAFDIVQDQASGGIFVRNLTLRVHGQRYLLIRPLNSREPWPLWVESESDNDFDPIEVFDDSGKISAEMLSFIAED